MPWTNNHEQVKFYNLNSNVITTNSNTWEMSSGLEYRRANFNYVPVATFSPPFTWNIIKE